MILYKGELYPDSRQEALIASLKTDVYEPLRHGVPLRTEQVIAACDALAQRVKSGAFDEVVLPLLRRLGVSREQFSQMVRLFEREGLAYKCAVELDGEREIDGQRLRRRFPLGVLLHIAAGNVDALPAYSVVEGLLAGNVNILKLPMGDSGLSVRMLQELLAAEPALADYIYVFDVPSTETETLKALADLSDGVVVWGGDAAVRAARTLANIDTKIIAWGHKLSFAYAELDASDSQLDALARAICQTNQLLCSSCQGIFVDTESEEEQLCFAERFFAALRRANREAPPVDFGMRAKSAIELYNERLEQHATGKRILSADGVSVSVCADERLELSLLYRNVWVKRLPFERIFTLKANKNRLQTAAVLTTDAARGRDICEALANAGVVRITSGGNMSQTICGEAHDGTYALREYSRIVEIERFPF